MSRHFDIPSFRANFRLRFIAKASAELGNAVSALNRRDKDELPKKSGSPL